MLKGILWIGLLFLNIPCWARTEAVDVKPYLDYALEWTSYTYQGQPLPKFKRDRPEIIQIYAYGESEVAKAEAKGIQLRTVDAVYSPDDKSIHVSSDVDLADPKLQVTLSHEMVHYLQDINGYTRAMKDYLICTESEAYDVQMLWQKDHNVEVEDIPFVFQQAMLAATRCMGSKSSAFPKWEESKLN